MRAKSLWPAQLRLPLPEERRLALVNRYDNVEVSQVDQLRQVLTELKQIVVLLLKRDHEREDVEVCPGSIGELQFLALNGSSGVLLNRIWYRIYFRNCKYPYATRP